MRIAPLFVFGILALAAAACGPSGDDDHTGDDTTGAPDANTNNPAPDANTQQTVTGLGAPCTPDGADPMGQGDCDTGFVCLQLQGGAGAWCSKTCDSAMDPVAQCNPSLNADKGLGYCYLQVDFDGAGGNPPVNFCGVICTDTTGTCTGAGETCDGTCPNPLACTAALSDGTNTVAMGCQ